MATPARAGISAAAGDDVASADLLRVLHHITHRSVPGFCPAVASASSHGPQSRTVLLMAGPARADISASAGDDAASADLQVIPLTNGNPTPSFRSVAPSGDIAPSPTFPDLPEPLLLDILGRVPSRSCLFSASFVCRSWRALLSSARNRAFLREFFASHSPPLLGFFLQASLLEPVLFHPVSAFDPIVSDALAQGDFFLDHIPPLPDGDELMNWEIMDCQSGFLLLSWPETGDLMVYNPVNGYQQNVDSPQFVHHIGTYHLHLAVSLEGPFSIMCVYHTNGSTAQLSVFRFGERWRLFGQIETAEPWSSTHRRAVQSGNILFWPFLDREQMFAVDMVEEEGAFIDIPAQGMDFVVALTGDGHLTLLSAMSSSLCIWKRKLDSSHSQEHGWKLESFHIGSQFLQLFGLPLDTNTDLRLISVHHGLVYLCTLQAMECPDAPWVIFSFCLRTKEIQMAVIFDPVSLSFYGLSISIVSLDGQAAKAAGQVNSWVEKVTSGLIKELLPPGFVDHSTRLTEKFDASQTKDGEFHLLDGSGSSVQAPFRKKASVGQFKLPKFKISFGFEGSELLKSLGLQLPFNSEADLSQMVDSPVGQNFYVSSIFHRSFVEVNEEGTEAAASSAAVVALKSLPIGPMDFVADHPFLFVIREDMTGVM
ncbi:hypothetical protein EJB05_05689, partial [Eragrostis curvula]